MTNNNFKCLVCKTILFYQFTYQKKYNYYKCLRCGLFSTYPLPDRQTIKKHYKNRFQKGNYDLLRKYSKQYKRIYQNFTDEIEKTLLLKNKNQLRGLKVLDIGCFIGEFLELMKEKGAQVYGFELQKEAVKIANEKLHGRAYRIDVMNDKFPEQKFDIVTMIGLIEHVTNPIKLIKKCKKILKKDGLIFIQTPNTDSLFAKFMGKYWPPYSPVEHIHLFSRQSLEKVLRTNGFQHIQFKQSWKKLPIGYVYNMLKNFGPEFYVITKPFNFIINTVLKDFSFPFYIGEMIITAQKK